MEPIRIYLIYGYRLLTEAVACCLEARPEVAVAGVTQDLGEALERLAELAVDVVLIDASVARRQAVAMVAELAEKRPRLRLLPLGLESDDEVLAFLEAGASGYLMRRASFDELLATVAAVHRGEPPCSPQVAASVCARIVELAQARESRRRQPKAALTPRELEILALVAEGLRNKEIAGRLNITLATVKNHVHNVLDKLQVRNRRQAVQWAFDNLRLGRSAFAY